MSRNKKKSAVAAMATGSLVLGSLIGAHPVVADGQPGFYGIGSGADVRAHLANASDDIGVDCQMIAYGNRYFAAEQSCGEGTCGDSTSSNNHNSNSQKNGAEGACGEGTCGGDTSGMKTNGDGSKSQSGLRRSRSSRPTPQQQQRMLQNNRTSATDDSYGQQMQGTQDRQRMRQHTPNGQPMNGTAPQPGGHPNGNNQYPYGNGTAPQPAGHPNGNNQNHNGTAPQPAGHPNGNNHYRNGTAPQPAGHPNGNNHYRYGNGTAPQPAGHPNGQRRMNGVPSNGKAKNGGAEGACGEGTCGGSTSHRYQQPSGNYFSANDDDEDCGCRGKGSKKGTQFGR